MSTPALSPRRPGRFPWLRVFLVLLLLGGVGVGVWAYLYFVDRRPVVSTSLQIDQGGGLLPGPKPTPDEQARFRRNQIALVRSHAVLKHALSDPRVAKLSIVTSHIDPQAWLEENLEVDHPHPDSPDILRISLRGENTEESKQLVQAVADAFINEATSLRSDQSKGRQVAISELVKMYENKIAQSETKRKEDERFVASSNVTVRGKQMELHQEMARAVTRELARVRVEVVLASARPKKEAKEQGEVEVLVAQRKALEAEQEVLTRLIIKLGKEGTELDLVEEDVSHYKEMLQQLRREQERLRIELAYPPHYRVLEPPTVRSPRRKP